MEDLITFWKERWLIKRKENFNIIKEKKKEILDFYKFDIFNDEYLE